MYGRSEPRRHSAVIVFAFQASLIYHVHFHTGGQPAAPTSEGCSYDTSSVFQRGYSRLLKENFKLFLGALFLYLELQNLQPLQPGRSVLVVPKLDPKVAHHAYPVLHRIFHGAVRQSSANGSS